MDTPPLPADASDWLRAAFVGSKLADTEKAVREAKFLYEALKHRAQIERAEKSGKPKLPTESTLLGVVWNEFGHTVTLPGSIHRNEIIREATRQRWRVSIVSNRKSGELKVMAIERLP